MPRVKWNKNHIFGILTSRAINWHINELILRGRLVGGHLGGLHDFSGPLPANNRYIFGTLRSIPVDWHLYWVIWLKGGLSGCLVIEMHGMPPSRLRGCVQANYQQLITNLQFTYCVLQELHEWSKKALWQNFWLDLCTKQVVSARACAYQFLPYNSSGLYF